MILVGILCFIFGAAPFCIFWRIAEGDNRRLRKCSDMDFAARVAAERKAIDEKLRADRAEMKLKWVERAWQKLSIDVGVHAADPRWVAMNHDIMADRDEIGLVLAQEECDP